MTRTQSLAGWRILLVEDDFFIAEEVAADLMAAGAEVVGPVATLADALDLIRGTERLDGSVLDVNLHGETVYAVVDALRDRGVPVVFATGYTRGTIPERYADIPLFEKPVEIEQVARAMLGRPGALAS